MRNLGATTSQWLYGRRLKWTGCTEVANRLHVSGLPKYIDMRLEGNADSHLKFIRGEALSKKIPEAGISLQRGTAVDGAIEF